MNHSELMQNIREDYLKNPILLTDIQTPKDLEKVPFSSLLVMTETEWIKKYPSIDSKRVYYSGAHFGVIFYYEPEEHVLIDLASCLLLGPEKAQDAFRHRRQEIIQAIKTGDYFHAVSHLEHATLLHIARDIILSLTPSPALYQFFMDIYIYADSGAGLFTEEVIRRLMDAKNTEQENATKESLKDFPDEIVVYRGEGSASTPADKAYFLDNQQENSLSFCRILHWVTISYRNCQGQKGRCCRKVHRTRRRGIAPPPQHGVWQEDRISFYRRGISSSKS